MGNVVLERLLLLRREFDFGDTAIGADTHMILAANLERMIYVLHDQLFRGLIRRAA